MMENAIKKLMYIFLFTILIVSFIILFFSFAQTDNRTPYSEKVVLSESLLFTRKKGSLEANVSDCDIALKGNIISIEPYSIEMYTGHPELDEKLKAMGGPPVMEYTKYTVEVLENIIGDAGGEKTITYLEMGGLKDSVTKPQGNETVVLFLNKRPKGYVSVNGEHSIFTVSSKGKLYSFSNTKELSEYDGKDENVLFNDISKIVMNENTN